MGFRDDDAARRARIGTLEADVREKKAELAGHEQELAVLRAGGERLPLRARISAWWKMRADPWGDWRVLLGLSLAIASFVAVTWQVFGP